MAIISPWLTEKAAMLSERGQFSFLVAKRSTKAEIKKEIEKRFKVNVLGVTTVVVKGKVVNSRSHGRVFPARRSDVKKATVTLKKGQKIDIYPEAQSTEPEKKKSSKEKAAE